MVNLVPTRAIIALRGVSDFLPRKHIAQCCAELFLDNSICRCSSGKVFLIDFFGAARLEDSQHGPLRHTFAPSHVIEYKSLNRRTLAEQGGGGYSSKKSLPKPHAKTKSYLKQVFSPRLRASAVGPSVSFATCSLEPFLILLTAYAKVPAALSSRLMAGV